MPAARRAERLFELEPYWIARVDGSDRLYRFWYDARAGEIRRRSLKTADLEAAKRALAALVLREGPGHARRPLDVTLIAVLTRYWEEHSDARPNPWAARRAGNLWLDFLQDDAARVGAITQARQHAFFRHLHGMGLSVAYISRVQAIVAAALNRAVAADEDDSDALLTHVPKMIVQPRAIAEILNAPEPQPANWHPTIEELARFIDCIPPEEESRILRATVLSLIFGRPEAVLELTPFQIDRRDRLVMLNAAARRQTKKYRPTLPMPDCFWETLLSWCDAPTLVHHGKAAVVSLRKPWARVRLAAGLPPQMTRKALRHMLATEFRRRKVPKEDRELWQGHRRLSTNDRYGTFDPDYLKPAKDAVNDLLLELNAACKKPFLRQISAKTARIKAVEN